MDSLPLFSRVFQHLFLVTLALALVVRNKVTAKVAPSALASQVGVVGRWHQTDRLRRTNVLVAELMSTLLNRVGTEVIIVIDDYVVSWPNVSLKAEVCLEVEVKQERG